VALAVLVLAAGVTDRVLERTSWSATSYSYGVGLVWMGLMGLAWGGLWFRSNGARRAWIVLSSIYLPLTLSWFFSPLLRMWSDPANAAWRPTHTAVEVIFIVGVAALTTSLFLPSIRSRFTREEPDGFMRFLFVCLTVPVLLLGVASAAGLAWLDRKFVTVENGDLRLRDTFKGHLRGIQDRTLREVEAKKKIRFSRRDYGMGFVSEKSGLPVVFYVQGAPVEVTVMVLTAGKSHASMADLLKEAWQSGHADADSQLKEFEKHVRWEKPIQMPAGKQSAVGKRWVYQEKNVRASGVVLSMPFNRYTAHILSGTPGTAYDPHARLQSLLTDLSEKNP